MAYAVCLVLGRKSCSPNGVTLPLDSEAQELKLREETADFKAVVVPSETRLPSRLERGKDCEERAKEIDTIKHKRIRSGMTVAEIQTECSFFKIWKRVEVLSIEDKELFSGAKPVQNYGAPRYLYHHLCLQAAPNTCGPKCPSIL
jgi:hypothetical protein